MKTIEEKQAYANKLFNIARMAGIIKTQKEFADFLGINENTVGRALKGEEKYLTNNFFSRIETAFSNSGISLDNANITAPVQIQQGENQRQIIHKTTDKAATSAELIAELKEQRIMFSKQIEAQMDIIKNLTQALSRK